MKGFYSRKLHSLLGVIPLGFFILEHMITNFSAVEGGSQGFKDSVAFLNSLPLVLVLEIFGIFLPLLYHAVYGMFIAFQAKPNNTRFRNERNLRYLLQRITGVLVFAFVIWHLYETRFQVAIGNVTHEELGGVMHDIVMNPFFFILYLIGVLSAAFHFANGLWSFMVSWGITVGPRAQRVSSYICMTLFVIVSVLFTWSLFAFRGVEFQADGTALLETLRVFVG
ncbi:MULTISPECIES: succinate dehydrogenase cytochrome b558 subunit [Paenibacillus]|uniref:Succinate dehydrogenase cytochrome b558 subunit n=1 Tax=Paenibacillus vini TaxID=1476024 RepID=A0ABQ4MFR7_9BACL|nr:MULTISPECIES: succinate dehydrogenase cytochrome b558 subunit [Paenibacillus]MBQ4900713.1 succinate dehydrogenase cytochrome b558 subunit [Paenibacillus sp. Marseille-P2973]MDN4067955.1 succinate dehydrogenase cytochrome b558 subunit [Paenibacillus vini]GIP54789.1 succinate dehydrogenase cytochrome b558 subunit [Paenibacillus vini]